MQVTKQFRVGSGFWLRLLVLTVGAHGLFVIAITLADQLGARGGRRGSDVSVPLLIGFGLLYLSSLLRRRKQTAWLVAVLAYVFMLGIYLHRIEAAFRQHSWIELLTIFVVPVILISLLLAFRNYFTVRSDTRSFIYSLRISAVIIVVALIYGVVGFTLLDKHDFHQSVSVSAAVDRTLDQFGLTSSRELVPQTRRAHAFVDSLSVVSVGALTYVVLSLFQPIKARVTAGRHQREQAQTLLDTYHGNSEDFFKVWPADKLYYFDSTGQAGVAYRPQNRFALVVGDPFGDMTRYAALLQEFSDVCYGNDWTPALIHTTPQYRQLYEQNGYEVQKIGEEAIIDIAEFQATTRRDKYFRQITNKYRREAYTFEVCLPPHHKALITRLQSISDEWLTRPGRTERGFMMGYFSAEYMEQCTVLVARDPAGTIQGFLNQIPAPDPAEANFDLLRHATTAPGNINDFLLLGFIDHVASQGIARLNLGLSPLAGLDDLEETSLTSRALHLVHTNGDRFYSFSGLQRFKNKYKPQWDDRYVAYKGTPATFLAVMTAVTTALRRPRR